MTFKCSPKAFILFFSMLLLLALLSARLSGFAFASDGTPFTTINVPGTFQAEDFNSGAINDVYFAHPSTQVTRETTYRNVTNVDLYSDGTNRYVVSSNDQAAGSPTAGYLSEYLKYTVNVSSVNAGWYDISFNAKQGSLGTKANIIVLIDGVQKGAAGSITGTTLQNYMLPMPVNLGAGTHVLTIEFSGPDPATYLNTITFAKRSSAPSFPAPAIKSGLISSDEVVVANVTAVADTTGATDATAAIQSALDQAREMGGGVVFLPAGTYRLNGGLSIPTNVTLRGDWGNPVQGTPQNGTILAAYSTSVSAVTLKAGNAVVRNLSIWYPNQGNYTGGVFTPTVYPYSIYSDSPSVNAANITLYNAYQGINFAAGSAANINNIYCTCLKQGITYDGNYEFSYLTNIFIDANLWKNAPSAITNKPTDIQTGYIQTYTKANLNGVKLLRNDGITIYGVSVNDASQGMLFDQGTFLPGGSWGGMFKINATVTTNFIQSLVTKFLHPDKVVEARTLDYVFAPSKKPSNTTNFYNVKNTPYSAAGDGITDDGTAIQNALNAASTAGGGTVFLPPGSYRVTGSLSIPTGVELRGSYDYLHAHETVDTTVLLAYNGKNTAAPDTATAFITLNANSGIRGFTVSYPEQGFVDGSDVNVAADLRSLYPIKTYPYTVRSNGSGTWMKYVELENAYNGADFATYASNSFVFSGNWINAAKKAIYVGGGTTGGWVEQSVITFGTFFQSKHTYSPHTYGFAVARDYTHYNEDGLTIGNSTNIKTLGVNSYGVKTGIRTKNEGAGSGPQNLQMYLSTIDYTSEPDVVFEGGGTIYLTGLTATGYNSLTTGNVYFAKTTSTFNGTLNVYDYVTAGGLNTGAAGVSRTGTSTVNLYDWNDPNYSLPLSQNKTTTANSSSSGNIPERATDGAITSKWMAVTKDVNNNYWLNVDLGASYSISRWVVKNAGMNSEDASLNTKSYKLQVSNDGGTTYSDVPGTNAAVSNNTADITDLTLGTPVTGQYYRLLITAGTQTGADGYARIQDFELYGTNNLALNKAAIANSDNGSRPSLAVDGKLDPGSKWVSTAASPNWLQVDLGGVFNISQWVVKNAHSDGSSSAIYNTQDYKLQYSADGITFNDCVGTNASVVGNAADITNLSLGTTCTGQYFRLYVTKGTQNGYDMYVRIQEFELYGIQVNSTNLALNKTAQANSNNGSGPALAVDGSVAPASKWVSVAGSVNWLSVDLGQAYTVNRWVVKHAGSDGASSDIYNTRDFQLQYSTDGINYSNVPGTNASVTGNSSRMTNLILGTPINARYFRLYISFGTQTGYDGYARIQEFELYESKNLALNKPATANSNNGSGPALAVDGSTAPASKWVSIAGSTNWLQVDLGGIYSISRWVVKHAASDGVSSTIYNSRDFKLQYSLDGVTFSDVPGTNGSVTGNSSNMTDLALGTPTAARYFRLYLTFGTQTGYDGYARIQEFELYN